MFIANFKFEINNIIKTQHVLKLITFSLNDKCDLYKYNF